MDEEADGRRKKAQLGQSILDNLGKVRPCLAQTCNEISNWRSCRPLVGGSFDQRACMSTRNQLPFAGTILIQYAWLQCKVGIEKRGKVSAI